MKGIKRVGWFAMGVVALLTAVCVSVVSSIVVVFSYAMMEGFKAASTGRGQQEVLSSVMSGIGDIIGIILVVTGVLLLAVFIPWFYFGCGRPKISRESARRVFAPRTLVVVVIIAAGLNYGINCLLQMVYTLAPQALESYQELMESAGLGVNAWANAAAVILAPLGEELIFRGVVFHYARRAVSGMGNAKAEFWIANIFQALLFGIYHMNLVQGIYAFFIGLALGYLCQRYRSVIPGMLAHLVFNGMSTLFDGVMYAWIPESLVWYGIIGGVGIALVLAVIILNGSPTADNKQNIAQS